MKHALAAAALAAVFSITTAAPASAQWSVSLSGSAVIPTSEFGDYAETGWGIGATLGHSVGERASILGSGTYGSVGHADSDDKTNLIGVGGALVYRLSDGTSFPFVAGGAGILGHQYSPDVGEGETEWQGYANAAAGFAFPLGGVNAFVLGNYVHGFDETTFFGIGAGIQIPLGGE